MKKAKTTIAIFGILTVVAVLSVSSASAHVTMHLVPTDTTVPEGECHSAYVEAWANIDTNDTLLCGQFAIHSDGSCINITDVSWGPDILPAWSSWNADADCWGPDHDMIMFTFDAAKTDSDQMICNFTVHCDALCCDSIFNFSCGEGGCDPLCPIEILDEDDIELYPDNVTLQNGTFKCCPNKPDLNVTEITVNADIPKAGGRAFGPTDHTGYKTQCNNISAEIIEGCGHATGAFNVSFEVDGAELCNFTEAGMAANEERTVWCNCSWYPLAGAHTINVTVDCNDTVAECDETNNTRRMDITATPLGYKGNHWQDGRNVTTLQCHSGDINLTYSVGDSYYLSGYYNPSWTDYDVNWTESDLPIPDGATIEKARLYVYYNWDKSPARNITDYLSLEFNGVDPIPLTDRIHYMDIKWPGYYPYGMLAYNVTDEFTTVGNNTANLTNSYPGGDKVSMDGMLLVVVYSHASEPARSIWLNEGYDMLTASEKGCLSGYGNDMNYGVSSEEATAYANFSGCGPITLSDIEQATLVTVATHGNEGDKNKLFFNGGEWPGVWSGYVAPTQLGMNETDVLAHLSATDNVAAFQSYIPDGGHCGDGLEAANAFLILCEKAGKTVISCDDAGNEKNSFLPGDSVSVRADANTLLVSMNYSIWIQAAGVKNGDTLVAGADPIGNRTTILTDGDGGFGTTLIWEIPDGAPATFTPYDIVVNNLDAGDTDKYDDEYDGIDSACVEGFLAPVPEFATIALFGMGLLTLTGYVYLGRRRRRA